MKNIISSLGFGVLLLVAGCKDGKNEKESLLTPEEKNVAPATNNTTIQQVQSTQATSTPQINSAPVTSGALNPEHGKPGHRCDIAVGAPLDSKPASAPSTAPGTNTTITPTVTTSQPSTAPAGSGNLNPEHGKPGHRCDIAVGAPLSSAPSTTTTSSPTSQPVVSSVPANQQKNAPVTPILPAASTTSSNPVAPGMNPEHGKPGHRCDIAVGAPLTGAPKQ